MSVDPALVPALEVGGTHVAAALVDIGPWRLVRTSGPDPLDASASAAVILDAIAACASRLDAPAGAAWGVAIPGPFDYERGIGRFKGVAKFDALRGVDVRAGLVDRIRPRPSGIAFINDAGAFLVGEWGAGAASGHERAVGITLGTGVGSAFLASGRIVDRGPEVPPEGRVDLLEIDGRPLEETVSRRAILRRYTELAAAPASGTGHGLDVRELAVHARAGDPTARAVFDEAFRALGLALGPWLVRFGATVLVVGGAMAASWDLLGPPLEAGIEAAAGTPAAIAGGPGAGGVPEAGDAPVAGGTLFARPASSGIAVVPAANGDASALLGAALHASALTRPPLDGHTGPATRGGPR